MKTPSWLSTCSSKLSISVANDAVLNLNPPQKLANNMYSSSSDSSSCSNSLDSGGTPTSLPSNLSIATHPSIPSLQKLTAESLNITVSTFPATSLKPHGGAATMINCLKVHEGLLYAVSGSDVTVYDVNSDLEIVDSFSSGDAGIKSLGFCGGRIFTAHQDCKIRAWEYSTKVKRHRIVATLPTVHDRLRNFMLPKNYVRVRRHRSKLWVEHYDVVSSIATSDNSLLHSVSWDRHLKIWNGSKFRCTESIKAHDDAINAVVVSNDAVIYTGSADSKIRVWGKKNSNEKRNALIATLERHKSAVNALALTSDGSVLFSGSCDRSILVWEREDSANYMAVVGALRGHSKAVLCLTTVGSEFLFSGSADRTVRIWSRGHGGKYCCLTVLDGHEKPVRAVEVHGGDGGGGGGEMTVFSGSFDGEVRVRKVVVSSETETTSSPSSYGSD